MSKHPPHSTGAINIGMWLPIYGGWLRTHEHPVGPDIRACIEAGRLAENLGYDFLYVSEDLLNSVHGPNLAVIDAWSLLSSLATITTHIGLCGALKPGMRSPLLTARMIDTVSRIAGRPVTLNITSGWWKEEFELAEVPWLDHKGRYARAEALLRSFSRLRNPDLVHKEPSEAAGAQPPADATGMGLNPALAPGIWISGHSERATELAAEWADCLFLNGLPDAQLARRIIKAKQAAIRWGRRMSIAVNAFVIASHEGSAAQERRAHIVQTRNDEAIAFFRAAMESSGAASWAGLTDELMIDANAGFSAGLIGSFAEIRERIATLSALGVDKIVCQFDDPLLDPGPFMEHVIAPLRAGRPAALPIRS